MKNGKLNIAILMLISIAFLLLAYNKGMNEDINGDFYIYYKGGKDFSENKPIYTLGLKDGGFTYPPFAAMFFSAFSFFPFHISAILFCYIINFILWGYSFFLLYKISKELFPAKNCTVPLLLAFLCSARFYWHNFIWVQANLIVLNTTLFGILYYLRGRYNLSYLFFLAGCFLKIIPVIFLICIALKRGYRDWGRIILLSLPFIIVPFIFRGLERGIGDWVDYYNAFIRPFARGQIDGDLISMGIPSFLTKLNTGNDSLGISPSLRLTQYNLELLIRVIQVLLLSGFFGRVIYRILKHKDKAFTGVDFCFMFLISLLIPGRVWEHHHVSTSFIYLYLFASLRFEGYKKTKYTVLTFCVFIGVIGTDTIGGTLYDFSQFYCFITILMIIISVILLVSKTTIPFAQFNETKGLIKEGEQNRQLNVTKMKILLGLS
jgi:hypothetical protein